MIEITTLEYQKIIYSWNQTDREYPKDKTIYQLFEEQVEQNPDNVALVFEDQELTYKELNQRSNQLARYIRRQYKEIANQELAPDTLIPLCLERSLDMVIGILAVMKAGGAYVPMDPDYPQERFRHIIKDTQAKLVITQSHLENKLHYIDKDIGSISIDSYQEQGYVYDQEAKENLESQSSSTDLAYVIYTSGTTGLPKGVMIQHNSIANYNQWMDNHYYFNDSSIIDCSASISFDATVNVLITPLCLSQTVVICRKNIKEDIKLYLNYIYENKIELIKITPSYLSILLSYIKEKKYEFKYLKSIIIGGEKVNKKELEGFINFYPNINIIHHYGPTETTVGTTSFINFGKIYSQSIPIGKVAINNKAYILDQYQQPLPVGVVGELYIGGAGLARGYLNRPELTAERFIENPFATESDIANGYTRLYKTGDLVRWLADGNIEYIGRNDDQVKIRGFRIELGEIENQLSSIEGIKQSCVLAKERNNNKYLVGYYVSDKESLTQEEIFNQLSKVLPEYMVPSVLVEIDSMPLTVNGKLDRKALPDPEFINEDSYIAPTTELEEKLCNIFAEVLGLDRVGITDDFFRVGGDSIVSIQLSSRLRRNEIDCSVRDI
ncbi:non-ribosomal peptide synthetase, partial [Francisella sp. 19X1-34]|uniref:non-ribosomal peptide synthetase n=1 Tax=Francisella sp. 19X1-34 TaxID=3087177 RepID=UPI002E371120